MIVFELAQTTRSGAKSTSQTEGLHFRYVYIRKEMGLTPHFFPILQHTRDV